MRSALSTNITIGRHPTATHPCRCLVMQDCLMGDWARCRHMTSVGILRQAGAIAGITCRRRKTIQLLHGLPSTYRCDIIWRTSRWMPLPNSFHRTIRSATAAASTTRHLRRPCFTELSRCRHDVSGGMRPRPHDPHKFSVYCAEKQPPSNTESIKLQCVL